MLDAARDEATAVLLDHRFFQVDARMFTRFVAALDAASADNPRRQMVLGPKARSKRFDRSFCGSDGVVDVAQVVPFTGVFEPLQIQHGCELITTDSDSDRVH